MQAQLAALLAATLADVDRLSRALAAAHRRAASAEHALRTVSPAPSFPAIAAVVGHADARTRAADARATRVLDALADAVRAEDDAMARRRSLDAAVGTKRQAACDDEDVDELLLETVAPPRALHPAKRPRLSPATPAPAPRPSPPPTTTNTTTTTSPSPPARLSPSSSATLPPANPRRCHACTLPGRYKDGKCIEKWGPGPHGPGTVCDRCRKKIKRVERRETVSGGGGGGAIKPAAGLTPHTSRDSLSLASAHSSFSGPAAPHNSLHPTSTSTSTSPRPKHAPHYPPSAHRAYLPPPPPPPPPHPAAAPSPTSPRSSHHVRNNAPHARRSPPALAVVKTEA